MGKNRRSVEKTYGTDFYQSWPTSFLTGQNNFEEQNGRFTL